MGPTLGTPHHHHHLFLPEWVSSLHVVAWSVVSGDHHSRFAIASDYVSTAAGEHRPFYAQPRHSPSWNSRVPRSRPARVGPDSTSTGTQNGYKHTVSNDMTTCLAANASTMRKTSAEERTDHHSDNLRRVNGAKRGRRCDW